MTIQIGDKFPDATLGESVEFGAACPLAPKTFSAAKALAGKKVVVFGVPGAFTPTCSEKHVPDYLAHLAELKKKGVDEVWCVCQNDPFVAAAWGKQEGAIGKIRMLGDGSGELARKLGLDLDLSAHGLGHRAQRYSMYVEDGVVRQLHVEKAPPAYEVSNAKTLLAAL